MPAVDHEHDPVTCAPKLCRECEELKWGCEFYTHRKICKRCHLNKNRNWRMTEGHGQERNWINRGVEFTVEDYDRMMKEQDGKCAICLLPFQVDIRPPLDHNHQTGVVRGILCKPCNTLLGLAKDDVAILLSAAQYLVERGGSN